LIRALHGIFWIVDRWIKQEIKIQEIGQQTNSSIFFHQLTWTLFKKTKTWNICYKQIKESLTKKQIPGPKDARKTTDGGFWNTTKKMCCNVFFIKGTTRPIPQSMMCARGQMWFTRLHVSIMCTNSYYKAGESALRSLAHFGSSKKYSCQKTCKSNYLC